MATNPRRTVDPKTGIVKFPSYEIVSTGPIKTSMALLENPAKNLLRKNLLDINFIIPKRMPLNLP